MTRKPDPLVAALREAQQDADRGAQSDDRDASEDASAQWHLVTSALRALKGR